MVPNTFAQHLIYNFPFGCQAKCMSLEFVIDKTNEICARAALIRNITTRG